MSDPESSDHEQIYLNQQPETNLPEVPAESFSSSNPTGSDDFFPTPNVLRTDRSIVVGKDKAVLDPNKGALLPLISRGIDQMTYASIISLDVTKPGLHLVTTVDSIGNATINATSAGQKGQTLYVMVTNDGASAKTITFGTNFSAGTLTGTIGNTAVVFFISDGTIFREVSRSLSFPLTATQAPGTYQNVASATLSPDGSSFTVSSIPNYEFYKVELVIRDISSNAAVVEIQFNGDTGNNYGWVNDQNGTVRQSSPASAFIQLEGITVNADTALYMTLWIHNIAGVRKRVIYEGYIDDAGSTSGYYVKGGGRWTNAVNAINSIKVLASNGNLGINSKITVYALTA